VLVLTKREPKHTESWKTERRVSGTVLSMAFVGANVSQRFQGKGNYPARSITSSATTEKVANQILPPMAEFYIVRSIRELTWPTTAAKVKLEYDFVVRPGADLRRIVLGFSGAERLEVDAEGDLVLQTGLGAIRQRKPVVYQEIGGVRREILGSYALKGPDQVGFKVAAYDPVGRSSSTRFFSTPPISAAAAKNVGSGIALDSSGNAYVTGNHLGQLPHDRRRVPDNLRRHPRLPL